MYSVVKGSYSRRAKCSGRTVVRLIRQYINFCNNILAKGNILKITQLNLYTHVRILRPPVGATACEEKGRNYEVCSGLPQFELSNETR